MIPKFCKVCLGRLEKSGDICDKATCAKAHRNTLIEMHAMDRGVRIQPVMNAYFDVERNPLIQLKAGVDRLEASKHRNLVLAGAQTEYSRSMAQYLGMNSIYGKMVESAVHKCSAQAIGMTLGKQEDCSFCNQSSCRPGCTAQHIHKDAPLPLGNPVGCQRCSYSLEEHDINAKTRSETCGLFTAASHYCPHTQKNAVGHKADCLFCVRNKAVDGPTGDPVIDLARTLGTDMPLSKNGVNHSCISGDVRAGWQLNCARCIQTKKFYGGQYVEPKEPSGLQGTDYVSAYPDHKPKRTLHDYVLNATRMSENQLTPEQNGLKVIPCFCTRDNCVGWITTHKDDTSNAEEIRVRRENQFNIAMQKFHYNDRHTVFELASKFQVEGCYGPAKLLTAHALKLRDA